VVAYLLSEKRLTCINARDEEGNTPLMLAVMYGNTRVVRRLLIAGADRYLANSEAKIPMDIALEA
jgi:ankyrin repeat protein